MKLHFHIIFWLVVIGLLMAVFTPNLNSISEAVYFIAMLLPVVLGTCYFFNYILIPRFLLTRKYGKFILYSTYMLIISLYLEMVVIMLSFIFLAKYSYNNMSPVSSDVLVLAVTLYFVVLLFSFILLIKRNFSRERTISELESDKLRNETSFLTVRSERQNRQIDISEVTYIESLGDYVKINLIDGKQISTREKISSLEERLPDCFIRIHRSFLINKEKVRSFQHDTILVGDTDLPISRSYRDRVLETLKEGLPGK